MKTEPNDAMGVIVEEVTHGMSDIRTMDVTNIGLTKREHFAGLAMASYYGGEFIGKSGMPFETIAESCVKMADALINELNKNSEA